MRYENDQIICWKRMKGRRETLGEGSRQEKLQSTQDFKLKLSQSEVCQTKCICCSCFASCALYWPRSTKVWFFMVNWAVLSSVVQLERFWVTCSRCPEFGGRTTSSTRASLSTKTSCSATTCRHLPHLEDTRPRRRSSSWPLASTRCFAAFQPSSRERGSAVVDHDFFLLPVSAWCGFWLSSAVLPCGHRRFQRSFSWCPHWSPHPRHGN